MAVGEKTSAAVKKVKFSENLNKLFPKADEIFNDQKIDFGDDDDLPKHEIMIPNTQTLFKELNDGKLPEELKFFLVGSDSGNKFKFHMMQNIGILNESNEHFIDYLLSDFAKEVFPKNIMKIHLDMGNVYDDNLNTKESIYSFMYAQQDETKKFMDFELDISDDFEFYLNEIIAGITDDKFDMDMHSTSKFLFYHFNNLRCYLGEKAYKIRHTIVSDNQHALETLQSKDWPYFINRLVEVSEGDITWLNLHGISQNENDVEELKIINDTIENLEICKNYFAAIYANGSSSFQNYLKIAPDVLIEKMEDDLRLNLYSSIDLKMNLTQKRLYTHSIDFSLHLEDFLQSTNRQLLQQVMCLVLFDRVTLFHLLSYIKKLVWVRLED